MWGTDVHDRSAMKNEHNRVRTCVLWLRSGHEAAAAGAKRPLVREASHTRAERVRRV